MKRVALWVLLMGCSSEPGTSGGGPASAASATSAASAASVAPATAPASTAPVPARARLVGQWQVDLEYIKTDPEMVALPPEKREKALEMARTVLKNLRIVFSADGTVKVGVQERMREGTYVVTPTGAQTMVVDAKMTDANGAEQSESLKVEFVGAKIMVTGPDGKATRFEKATP